MIRRFDLTHHQGAEQMVGKYVVVTTANNGVFFGRLKEVEDADPERDARPPILTFAVVLTNARNCLRWGSETKGFLGLAATGPIGQCRVGPAVLTLRLYGVTSITECTDVACAAWEAEPWN